MTLRLTTLTFLTASLLFLPLRGFAHGAYHLVVKELAERLHSHPTDRDARLRLAKAHLEHEEWHNCLEEIRTLDDQHCPSHLTASIRGAALLGQGKPTEALVALDAFLKTEDTVRHPADAAAARVIRGRVYMAIGKPSVAAADFAEAMAVQAAPPELFGEYSESLVAAGRKKEALTALDRALATYQDDPALLTRALDLQIDLSRWDAALETVDALADLAPTPEPWMARRAQLLGRAGRTEQARTAWSELNDHLAALPSLQRGTPQNLALLTEAAAALNVAATPPVAAAPR